MIAGYGTEKNIKGCHPQNLLGKIKTNEEKSKELISS